jgi:hypothetical protein
MADLKRINTTVSNILARVEALESKKLDERLVAVANDLRR